MKKILGVAMFLLFVVIMPLLTIYFSKSGLDTYKEIRNEMRFYKDSLHVNLDKKLTLSGDTLKNELLVERTVLVSFWNDNCKESFGKTLQTIEKIKQNFSKEDNNKIVSLIHVGNLTKDSTWSFGQYADQWKIDSSDWFLVTGAVNHATYKINPKEACHSVAILDGRVSRKDDTKDYLKGPILCDNYDLTDTTVVKKMLRNMVIVLPKKDRKRLEFKADKKLF